MHKHRHKSRQIEIGEKTDRLRNERDGEVIVQIIGFCQYSNLEPPADEISKKPHEKEQFKP